MIKDRKSLKYFTLIELIAAMGVFAIIMIVILTFFSSAQKAMSVSIQRTMTYENARIALDLIARDLQCAYYEKDKIPFWFKGYTTYALADAVYNQEALCFVSATSLPPNDNCSSNLCEVKYQLYNYDNTAIPPGDPKLEGWLQRSVTGNRTDAVVPLNNSKWNFFIGTPIWPPGIAGQSGSIYSADGTSSGDPLTGDFRKVIPHVTKLEFTCFAKDGTPIVANATAPTAFPYEVKIDLTLMDGASWAKWKAMGGEQYVNVTLITGSSSATTNDFRKNNERTFSKTVLLGDRGQY